MSGFSRHAPQACVNYAVGNRVTVCYLATWSQRFWQLEARNGPGIPTSPAAQLSSTIACEESQALTDHNRYITQESHKLEIQARPPIAVTNAVSWRSEGIRYRKNEVFLDVVESLNLLVSSSGNVLRSEILGAIKMKCYLSGMPELRLGLNDKVMFETTGRATRGKAIEMEDVKFHQCVRLSRFENDRTISFIPPDGEFELMSYRLNTQVKPLIWVECVVESHSGSRIEYMLKVG